MKLYGRTFKEIYRLLPIPYKVVVLTGTAFLVFVLIQVVIRPLFRDEKPIAEPISFNGLGWEKSAYDPAIEIDPVTGKAYMAFSNIRTLDIREDQSAVVQDPAQRPRRAKSNRIVGPGVRIASSDASCQKWQVLPHTLNPEPDTIMAPDGQTILASGMWRYETPALVYDPDDAEREWKLYAYKYMWANDRNLGVTRRYGVIVSQYTSDPAGEWSTEEWAFSAAPDYPPMPYQSMVNLHLNTLDPSLADITFYARPSVLSVDGHLVMSLSAFTTGATPDRVVLFLSPDHGAHWTFAGTVLKASEVSKLGVAKTLGGATLLKQRQSVYLAAVLGDDKAAGLGTFIFGFEDLGKAKLSRTVEDVPVLLNHLPRNSLSPTNIGGGYAAYKDSCADGILTGEFSGIKDVFQIFATHKKPIGE